MCVDGLTIYPILAISDEGAGLEDNVMMEWM
jgi:hypothetical protein